MRPWIRSGLFASTAVLVLAGTSAAVDSYNMVLLKNINVYNSANDCWGYTAPNGTELAIYGHLTGTSFVDATDPANAVEVFNLPGPNSIWRDMKVYQNYAYIVTEGAGAGAGIQIVDLDDPLNPVHVGTYTGAGYNTAHNIWIDEPAGVAYACGGVGGGMHILSLADPENLVELDFFNPYYIHDLYVGNGLAYAGAINSGSLRIIDVSNPSTPVTIASHFYSGANTHNAWPNDAGTYCITSDETGGGHLKIWDITNLPTVTLASEYIPSNEPTGVIHNATVKNDLAYISWYKAGARIVDITDPTNPVEVGYYDTHQGAGGLFDGDWGIYPFRSDNVVYASDRQTGLYILEFTGGYAGDVSGVVRDSGSGTGLDGAEVALSGGPAPLQTDALGNYSGSFAAGTYTVVTTLFGYAPDTSAVAIPEGGAVVNDVDLVALPAGSVELHLVEAGTSIPVVGAIVDVPGTPVPSMVSDAAGVVTLPPLPAGTGWTVHAGKFGRANATQAVVPTAGVTTPVTVGMARGLADDFEFQQAWTFGAPGDDATDGHWERAVPVGSFFGGAVGPAADASPTGEGWALVTENHVSGAFVGTSDVDNGKTTVLTPVFDASGLGTLRLDYQRWFSNRAPSQASDEFRADVSTDGGGSWTNVETVSVGTDSWAAVSIDLTALVPATSTMQLRFVAEDLGGDTYVEAGVDDLEIVTGATAVLPTAVAETRGPELSAPAPNPFQESAELSFQLPATGPASLEVFDVSGRRVAILLSGKRIGAGTHRVRWSGRDDNGDAVAPGVYFARLITPYGGQTRKITRLH